MFINEVAFVISSMYLMFILCPQDISSQTLSADSIFYLARNVEPGYYYYIETEEGLVEMFEHYKLIYENQDALDAAKIKAAYELYRCYKYGSGTEQNDDKANEYMNSGIVLAQQFLSGAEQKDRANVLCSLGQIYELRGMDETALDLYKKAADLNNAEGMYLYGDLLRLGLNSGMIDQRTGLTWIEKSAQNGYYQAPSVIGWLYFYGDTDWERNYEKAIPWLKESSKYDEESCLLLGKSYFYGLGVEQDYAQAINYLSKTHFGEANYLLAQCYALGLGINTDREQATHE